MALESVNAFREVSGRLHTSPGLNPPGTPVTFRVEPGLWADSLDLKSCPLAICLFSHLPPHNTPPPHPSPPSSQSPSILSSLSCLCTVSVSRTSSTVFSWAGAHRLETRSPAWRMGPGGKVNDAGGALGRWLCRARGPDTGPVRVGDAMPGSLGLRRAAGWGWGIPTEHRACRKGQGVTQHCSFWKLCFNIEVARDASL